MLARAPITAKASSSLFLLPPMSASVPSTGALSAVISMASALASAQRAVARTRARSGSGSSPVAIWVVNHTGKIAAIIVVANALCPTS